MKGESTLAIDTTIPCLFSKLKIYLQPSVIASLYRFIDYFERKEVEGTSTSNNSSLIVKIKET